MEKSVHYTERERMLLAQLISEEKTIKSKKTDATNLKDIADAWNRVTKKFISERCTPRSSKQLKKCWNNMKQKKRKLNTEIRHEWLMTSGGPAPVQLNDPVIEFMDATNVNLDVELDCPCDSTAVFEEEYNTKINSTSTTKKVIVEDESEKEEEDKIDTNKTYDQSILVASYSRSKKKIIPNIQSIRDEKELRLIKLREAIEQQRELHSIRKTIAEAEVKIVLLKLLKEEEALKQTT